MPMIAPVSELRNYGQVLEKVMWVLFQLSC